MSRIDNSTFKKPCTFKPFDKVVGRFFDGYWKADFFSHYKEGDVTGLPFRGISGMYCECVPYNEETAKLIGTKNNEV
jgi:hypothetical protein